MYKESFFLKIITYGPLFFIPFIIGVMLLISMQIYNESFEKNIEEAEKNLYNLEKQAIKDKVNRISNLITYKKSIIKDELISRVKDRVKKASLIAHNIYNVNKDTKTELEVKQMIKDALRPLIWNNGESFIWIVDYEGVFNLAPEYLTHLEGSSIINFQDATGRYVIQEEIAICKDKGEGFLWDTFTKPNDPSQKQYEQVAFVESFGHYNWYIGSGEYLDTATKKSDEVLLKTIQKIDAINEHYIFLLDDKENLYIAQSQLNILGKNISQMEDKEIKEAVQKIIATLKDKETSSLSYIIKNPKTDLSEKKYSYIKRIPNTNWIIGSGFYLSDIQDKLSKQKIDIYEMFYQKFKDIVYLAVVLILFSLLVSYYISQKLKMSFNRYEKSIDNKNIELLELNNSLELKVKQRTTELEKMAEELEVLATTDSLTNMNNRYAIMNLLSAEINRSNRDNTPLSLLIFDIDFFKKVNDTYGHDIGDNVLSTLSTLVKESLREADMVGRYGGEEFLIILANSSLEDSQYFAQSLRKKVALYSFKDVKQITISIGLVELQSGETIGELFKRADKLLYKSKEDGRNRVSF